jgi:signal peptidase
MLKLKKLTEKQKKILNIVLTAVQIALVVLAITASAIVLANPRTDTAEVGKGPVKLLPVRTDSMKGAGKDNFSAGDLIIAKKPPKNLDELKVGDIITFRADIGGQSELNTHRIVKKEYTASGKPFFRTKGDNAEGIDDGFADERNLLAVYKSRLKGVGKSVNWLQKPTNFFCVILLPLILLFAYNIFLLVRMLMHAKISKIKEQAGAAALDEEEIKKKAIEEYIANKEQPPKN